MRCVKVEKLLAADQLGLLSPRKQEQLQAHLLQCAHCKNILVQYQEVFKVLPENENLQAPQYLAAQVVNAAQTTTTTAPAWRSGRSWVFAGATALLLVAIIPWWQYYQVSRANQQVLAEYSEDLQNLGFWKPASNEETSESEAYDALGIPTVLSKLLI